MKKAAVVIGVNKTGHLAPLTGAAKGAKDFAGWAEANGFDVTLFTDDDKREVTVEEIKTAIREIVDARIYEQLIVFFAGHGLLKTPGVEMWLLSRSSDDADEAVDVFASSELARNAKIPHIIFVSDACRSLGHRIHHLQTRGSAIFPNREPEPPRPPVDLFYATMPGGESYEVKDEDEAIAGYKGIFTECLLDALHGNVPEVVVEYRGKGKTRWLIPSETLDLHLMEAVPRAARDVHIALNQYPEVRANSRPPLTFGELSAAPTAGKILGAFRRIKLFASWAVGLSGFSAGMMGLSRFSGGVFIAPPVPPTRPPRIRDLADEHQRKLLSGDFDADLPVGFDSIEPFFRESVDRIAGARGRAAFETSTGFTVYGDIDSALVGADGKCEVFEEDGRPHVRVEWGNDTRSALIRFTSGFGAVLPVIPGFIGTVMVEDDQVVNVSFTPSRNTPLYVEEYAPIAERIERRRAFAAVATRNGVFRMDAGDPAGAGDYLRMLKRLDPTLGIYAAYSYAQSGDIEQVRDVLKYMEQDGNVPFDLLVLAQDVRAWDRQRALARPFCPALTQGWSLILTDGPSSERLGALASMLAPSLWTVFRPEGAAEVADRMKKGELV